MAPLEARLPVSDDIRQIISDLFRVYEFLEGVYTGCAEVLSMPEVQRLLSWSFCLLCLLVIVPYILSRRALQAHQKALGQKLPGPDAKGPDGHVKEFLAEGGFDGASSSFLSGLHKEHGPVVRFWLNKDLYISVADPAWAMTLLSTEAERTDREKHLYKSFLGLHNIFSKANRAKDRKSNVSILHTFLATVLDEGLPLSTAADAALAAGGWTSSAWDEAAGSGAELDVLRDMRVAVLDMVGLGLFGEVWRGKRGRKLAGSLAEAAAEAPRWSSLNRVQRWLSGGYWAWLKSTFSINQLSWDSIADVLLAEEEARAAAPAFKKSHRGVLSKGRGVDFIGQFVYARTAKRDTIVLSRAEMANHVTATLWGALDTMTPVLVWALVEIARHPHVLQRIHEELDRVVGNMTLAQDHLAQLDYLGAVIWETLRLHPPQTRLERSLPNDIKIGSHVLPGFRTTLIVPVALMQTDPRLWGKGADSFDPDRFLRTSTNPAKTAHPTAKAAAGTEAATDVISSNDPPPPPSFSYLDPSHKECLLLAFGSGPRSCPGSKFALLLMRALLASVLHRHVVKLAPVQGEFRAGRRGVLWVPVPDPQLVVVKRG